MVIGDLKAEYVIPTTPEPELETYNLKIEQKFTDIELPLAKWQPEDEMMEDLDVDGEPMPLKPLNHIQYSIPKMEVSSLHPMPDVQYNKETILEIEEENYSADDDVIFVSSNPINDRKRLIPPSRNRVIDLTG